MSDEVDVCWASNRARECADRSVLNCYAEQWQDSDLAILHWARTFKREYNALTQPSPLPKDHL
jgi:hypothetical protein